MEHAFNIYPALFILTPIMQEHTIQINLQAKNQEASGNGREGCFRNWPQSFWGDCLFNESHTQFVLRFENNMKGCPVQKHLDEKINALKPSKFKGKRYAITFIPVMN